MVIVLVDSDPFEVEIAQTDLAHALSGPEVIVVNNVSEFLTRADELRTADIVVTERYLVLMLPGDSEEDFEKDNADLLKRFPDVAAASWESRDAGWVLARWMRKNGFQMPILFHTHSEEASIPDDLRQDPHVKYCHKSSDPRKIAVAIKDIVTPHWRSYIDRHMTP